MTKPAKSSKPKRIRKMHETNLLKEIEYYTFNLPQAAMTNKK